MNLELKKAIDQISKDKGIDREMLIDTLEEAIRASVTKKYGDKMDIEVTFNEETGRIEVYQFKIVVEEVEDSDTEILMVDALKHDPNVELDDAIGFRLQSRTWGASQPRAPSRSSSSACATPSRRSFTRNTRTARARSSAASSSAATVRAGSSTSAAPRPCCPRTSRSRASASARATASKV